MAGDVGSIRYSLREPFERAVESVCASLANRGLGVAGQLDISRRVERHLGIVLPACKIVFVLPDPSALSTANIHPWAAIFLPLHIVISGNDTQTEIEVQNRVHPGSEDTAPALAAPIVQTQTEILAAIEAIAVRTSPVV
jgi:uncharacterized protein (DUF302 family)